MIFKVFTKCSLIGAAVALRLNLHAARGAPPATPARPATPETPAAPAAPATPDLVTEPLAHWDSDGSDETIPQSAVDAEPEDDRVCSAYQGESLVGHNGAVTWGRCLAFCKTISGASCATWLKEATNVTMLSSFLAFLAIQVEGGTERSYHCQCYDALSVRSQGGWQALTFAAGAPAAKCLSTEISYPCS